MHLTSATAAFLLALTKTALSANIILQNNCDQTLYLNTINMTQQSTRYAILQNATETLPLSGSGNNYGVTKLPDYYTTSTPKFNFAYTDSVPDKLTYWTVVAQDGDAFPGQKWSVKPTDQSCDGITAYDEGKVHVCEDGSDITLAFC